jgi:hypothetical protein
MLICVDQNLVKRSCHWGTRTDDLVLRAAPSLVSGAVSASSKPKARLHSRSSAVEAVYREAFRDLKLELL